MEVDECEAHYCQNDATCMVSVTEIERYREIEIDIDTERGREREFFCSHRMSSILSRACVLLAGLAVSVLLILMSVRLHPVRMEGPAM